MTSAVLATSLLGGVLLVANVLAGRGDWTNADDAINGTVFGLLGGMLLLRRRGGRLGAVLLGAAGFLALAAATTQYGLLEAAPLTAAATWVGGWVWVPGAFALSTTAVLLFPDGELPATRLARPLVVASLVAPTSFAVLLALPEGTEGPMTTVAGALGVGLGLAAAIGAVATTVIRHRRAAGEARAQLGLLLFGASAIIAAILLGQLPVLGPFLQAVAYPVLAACFGLAILRHGLYDLDVAVRRAVVLASVVVSAAAVFVLLLQVATQVAPDAAPAATAVVPAVLVAIALHPLHVRLQQGADRLLHGDREAAHTALRELGARLADTSTPAGTLEAVADAVVNATSAAWVRLHLDDGAGTVLEITRGTPVDGGLDVPLRFEGRQIGTVSVGTPDGVLDRRDVRAVQDLALRLGPAAQAALATRALQQSRAGIVRAREEERRRLRSDVHDGLGPHLAALRLQLATARAAAGDPGRMAALLDRLDAGVEHASDEARRLVDGLRPPALDRGLSAAVRQLVTGLEGATTAVSVVVPDELPQLPAAVEVAAYRVIAEALTNAVRHSRACRVAIEVTAGIDAVVTTVSDDGIGFDASPTVGRSRGVGLSSMRSRAEELGGVLAVATSPSGTTVTLTLPLESPP